MTIVSAATGVVVLGTLIYAGYLLGGRHARQYATRHGQWRREWRQLWRGQRRRVATVATLVVAGACVVVMVLTPVLPHHMGQTLLGIIPVATYFLGVGAGRSDGRRGGEIRGYDQGFLDALEHGRPGVDR
jgi:hypothetical protein